jgi:rhodanese-related sulfurtransferase
MTDSGPAEGGAGARRRTVNDLLEDARARLDRLKPAAAHRAVLDDGAILIDTRCAELRREAGVVPGSIHVPLSVLYWRVDPASGYDDPRLSNPASWLILLCAHGYSSSVAAATMRDLGFDRATDIVGGFEAWASAGLPVEPATDN